MTFSIKDKNLTLDLAFSSAIENELKDVHDISSKFLLTHAEAWEKNLIDWLQIIRNDLTLNCPNIVRIASSLTMGLQFTDDKTITEMNLFWRNINKNTDVLSFPVIDEQNVLPEDQPVELGDIIISVPTAKRQAKERNHELGIELKWLVSHGLLHLLGWDHPDIESLREMLKCQEQLLAINGNLSLLEH